MVIKYCLFYVDVIYDVKYGIRNWEGGGRFLVREIIG